MGIAQIRSQEIHKASKGSWHKPAVRIHKTESELAVEVTETQGGKGRGWCQGIREALA